MFNSREGAWILVSVVAAVKVKPMPSEAADYGEPYYFDLNWMSIKLTQLLLAEVTSP